MKKYKTNDVGGCYSKKSFSADTLKKKILFLSLVFIVHFVLQVGSFFYAFGWGLQTLDDNSYITRLKADVGGVVFDILSFPVVYIIARLPSFLPGGLVQWTPFLLNSLLWSFAVYAIAKKYYKIEGKK